MAEGTNLAKAYVQILPSMDGFQSKLEKEMGGSGEAAGKKSGTSFGGAFSAAAGAAAKAGIAAVCKTALIGEDEHGQNLTGESLLAVINALFS